MYEKTEIIVGLVVALMTLVAVFITQNVANQPLSDHDLRQQLVNLDSFAIETDLILDQYAQQKLEFNYVKNQAEQIDKTVHDFYSMLEAKPVTDEEQDKVAAVEKLVWQFSQQLKRIETSEGDITKLNEVRQAVKQLHNQITQSEQQYA